MAPTKKPPAKAFHLPPRYSTTGDVFVVGSGDCGQLGLGPTILEKAKLGKLAFFDGIPVVLVRAGGLHCMALDASGKLYSWGCNDQKCLGRTGEETVPLPVEGLEGVVIVDVVCGDSMTTALSSAGEVYCWGTFRNNTGIFGLIPQTEVMALPYKLPDLKHVVKIAAGANHCLAINADGHVSSWGVGEQGQLGRKIMPRHAEESSLIPRAVSLKAPGVRGSGKWSNAYCGAYHSFAVSLSATSVLAFGLNNHGQLGVATSSETEIETPAPVEGLPPSEKIKQIAGGEHHTLLLLESGQVYGFGRGDSHQLGLGDDGSKSVPTLNPLLPPLLQGTPKDETVTAIDCGSAFSLAVTSAKENNLFMWGYGEMGQLANFDEGDEETPHRVALNGRRAITAAAGGQHTVFLVHPKD